jgi:hypothetical protein
MDWTRRVVTAAGIAGVIGIAIIASVGIWFWQGGLLVVQVHERGPHASDIALKLPAAPLQAMLALVPDGCIERNAEMTRVLPHLRSIPRDLARIPNCVLVEVEDRGSDETVRIAKEGRHLVIDVRSPEETVHVSVPIRFLGAALKRLGSCSPTDTKASNAAEPSA